MKRSQFVSAARLGRIAVAVAVMSSVLVAPATAATKKGGGSADLVLNVGRVAEASTVEGIDFDLIFDVSNKGPSSVSNVKLTDSYDPAHLEFVSAYSDRPVICSGSSGSQICDFGNLESGFSSWVALSFRRRTSTGTTLSTASVTSGVKDPDASNNAVSLTIPLYFASCSGYAPFLSLWDSYSLNVIRVYCEDGFTLTAPRSVVFRLTPGSDFRGLLEASLSSGLAQEKIAAVYSSGDSATGLTSKTVTLSPGTWRLTVETRAVSEGRTLPGRRCIGLPFRPPNDFGVCSPEAAGIYAPAGYGTFGGQVIDTSAAE
jgi:hypothetical protein